MRLTLQLTFGLLYISTTIACPTDDGPGLDAGRADAGSVDAGSVDAGSVDAGAVGVDNVSACEAANTAAKAAFVACDGDVDWQDVDCNRLEDVDADCEAHFAYYADIMCVAGDIVLPTGTVPDCVEAVDLVAECSDTVDAALDAISECDDTTTAADFRCKRYRNRVGMCDARFRWLESAECVNGAVVVDPEPTEQQAPCDPVFPDLSNYILCNEADETMSGVFDDCSAGDWPGVAESCSVYVGEDVDCTELWPYFTEATCENNTVVYGADVVPQCE